jgi:class 3 adenylate cyclase
VERGTGYAKSRGAHLAYVVEGDGPVDLVYTGTFLSPSESHNDEPLIERMLRRLAGFARLIRYDARGVGSSDPIDPAHPPTVGEHATDLVAVLDAVGSKRAALVCESAAGPLGICVAATHPERVTALVLVNTGARFTAADDYPIAIGLGFSQEYIDVNTDPDEQWLLDDSDDVSLLVATRAEDPRFREWWSRAARRGASPATARAIYSELIRADVRELLPAIAVPTLVVHSRANIFLPIELGEYVAERIPDARFVTLDTPDASMWGLDADRYVDVIEEFVTGKRSAPPERVLATVLFTDIVDSTARAAELGDRTWRALLDTHDAVVRAELERYGGREVNTTGDGFVGAFDSPTQAVRAAQAIVTRVPEASGLDVRAGIHTGECERRGDDLAGLAVHIAARVAGKADPGEVLVSRTVRDLVAGSELKLVDRGEHELKGVAEPWQLYALKQ